MHYQDTARCAAVMWQRCRRAATQGRLYLAAGDKLGRCAATAALTPALPARTAWKACVPHAYVRNLTTASSTTSLADLPDKVVLRTGPIGRLSKVLTPREAPKITTRVGSSFGGNHSLEWVQPPRTALLVKKRHDKRALAAMKDVLKHMGRRYPWMSAVVEQDTFEELHGFDAGIPILSVGQDKGLLPAKIDFVVTLGGDGTILHVSSLFSRDAVPPVLSFSMGTLGFLLPYQIESFPSALADLMESKVSLLLRMRLHQTMHEADGTEIHSCDSHLMNEVALHRGRLPHMTTIDAFVDGRHLTRAISDGIIIATPTGSTAYSLSAGGPIVHPSVQSLLLTPICPRSLSFRTVLLPSDSTLQLKVSPQSRSAAEMTVDGREVRTLRPGQFLQVAMSPFPIPCVNRTSLSERRAQQMTTQGLGAAAEEPQLIDASAVPHAPHAPSRHDSRQAQRQVGEHPSVFGHSERGEDDWVGDINTLLRFNASFTGRGLLGGNGAYEEGHAETAYETPPSSSPFSSNPSPPPANAGPSANARATLAEAESFVSQLASRLRIEGRVHLLGAHRRGEQGADRVVACIVDDETVAADPASEAGRLAVYVAHLETEGLVGQKGPEGDLLAILGPGRKVPLELHVVPSQCLGAAQLVLTGPPEFVDFLGLLADEGMGLRLDKWGLWTKGSGQSTKGTTAEMHGSVLPASSGEFEPGSTAQGRAGPSAPTSPLGHDTGGNSVLRDAERAARLAESLGLPRGTHLHLDLSLDLGSGGDSMGSSSSRRGKDDASPLPPRPPPLDSQSAPLQPRDGGAERPRLLALDGPGESHVLDVLGLAYLPPEARRIKVPAKDDATHSRDGKGAAD